MKEYFFFDPEDYLLVRRKDGERIEFEVKSATIKDTIGLVNKKVWELYKEEEEILVHNHNNFCILSFFHKKKDLEIVNND